MAHSILAFFGMLIGELLTIWIFVKLPVASRLTAPIFAVIAAFGLLGFIFTPTFNSWIVLKTACFAVMHLSLITAFLYSPANE